MRHFEQYEFIGHISPQQVLAGNQATVSQVIDTIGFSGGRLIVTVMQGNMVDSVGKCELTESDSSDSNFLDFMNASGKDADGSTRSLPDHTSDNLDIVFDVPLTPDRKRFMKVDWRAANTGGRFGSFVAASAILIGRQLGVEVTTANTTKRANSRLYSSKGRA